MQEHFGYSGGGAHIPVELERRVCAQKVGVGTAAVGHIGTLVGYGPQHAFEEFVRTVTILQTRPEVDFPGQRPAGTFVATGIEAHARGFRFGRGLGNRNLLARMQCIQV
ncbi:hypothetical protein D3C87_1686610 [compost metagenome]